MPPRLDIETSAIYGFLTVKIGKIVWIKLPGGLDGAKIKLKFWGEEGRGKILSAANSPSDLKSTYPTDATYQIRTSIISFSKY